MLSHLRATVYITIMLASVLLVFVFGVIGVIAGPAAPNKPDAPVPSFKHIFVIVLENKAYSQVLNNNQASYLNTLAHQYGLATNYYGITHPSLPNYLALLGGDTFGASSDCTGCFVNAPNLADQIDASGRTWKAYMEAMPRSCFVGDAAPLYRQKHNPFIYFDDIRTNPQRCNQIVPFTQFADDLRANALPDFVWITPDMCNDGHDCPLHTADAWLKNLVPAILQSPAWQDDGALFITFDEGRPTDTGGCCRRAQGGQIATLAISPLGRTGYTSQIAYDHYSLLRTIETSWGLPPLANAACDCSPTMADFFLPPSER